VQFVPVTLRVALVAFGKFVHERFRIGASGDPPDERRCEGGQIAAHFVGFSEPQAIRIALLF